MSIIAPVPSAGTSSPDADQSKISSLFLKILINMILEVQVGQTLSGLALNELTELVLLTKRRTCCCGKNNFDGKDEDEENFCGRNVLVGSSCGGLHNAGSAAAVAILPMLLL